MAEIKSKEPLNLVSDAVRAAKLVHEFGVGAMVNFPEQSLMTASPAWWQEDVTLIHDARLEKRLHVHGFGLPVRSSGKDTSKHVSYVRFPQWYFCEGCHRLKPLGEWIKLYRHSNYFDEKDPYMVKEKHIRCPICRHKLVPPRVVEVCDHGHIDDFPWVKWAHYADPSKRKICDEPDLVLQSNLGNAGVDALTVYCKHCHARASLKGVMQHAMEDLDKDLGASYFRCSGKHPWKHEQEPCTAYPHVYMRGASPIYYPFTITSLVIPPYANLLVVRVQASRAYGRAQEDMERTISRGHLEDIPVVIQDAAKDVQREIGGDRQKIEDILSSLLQQEQGGDTTSLDYWEEERRYKEQEYAALSGIAEQIDTADNFDFVREECPIEEYDSLPYLKQVSLIHKLREVCAMVGFSRVNPVTSMKSDGFVNIKPSDCNWYPGYEVRGEGIFIVLDDDMIKEWVVRNPEIGARAAMLQKHYDCSYFAANRKREITPKFLLLHSLAHALIRQLSFSCGYNIASIRERIYCSDEEAMPMSGILIYTANGDTEGALGGLVRQGYAESFTRLFPRAIDEIRQCSNDPICSLRQGQGNMNLNLAACHACLLLPETCCEEFNGFLDRGMLVGTMKHTEMGFFNYYAHREPDAASSPQPREQAPRHAEPNAESASPRVKLIRIDDRGEDCSQLPPDKVWQYLREDCDDDDDQTGVGLINQLEQALNGKKFYHGSHGTYWRNAENNEEFKVDQNIEEAGVMLFLACNRESYEAAQKTGRQCYLLDKDFDVQGFAERIMVK
ncbi:MAG: DUF1998 domain-containing protein [Selenomonadaceae bacterium]|nr:DUF1998 domain-containing protein [Selenomonadaceae bacterium]